MHYVYAEIPTLCESMMARRPPYISLMFIAYHSASATQVIQFRATFFVVCLFYLRECVRAPPGSGQQAQIIRGRPHQRQQAQQRRRRRCTKHKKKEK